MYIVVDYDTLADVLRDSRVRVPLPAPIYGRLAHALKPRVRERKSPSSKIRRTNDEDKEQIESEAKAEVVHNPSQSRMAKYNVI